MDAFKKDISAAPYHVGAVFDDFDDRFWFTSKLMESVADMHMPHAKYDGRSINLFLSWM